MCDVAKTKINYDQNSTEIEKKNENIMFAQVFPVKARNLIKTKVL